MGEYYTKAEDIPQTYLEDMKHLDITDEQKVELLNSLRMIIENIFDMHYGTGAYAGPHHDAAAWRAKQEALRNRTPEQIYKDAYDYWMDRYGKYKNKKLGTEAAEAECRKYAEVVVQKDMETKRLWEDFKERSHLEDAPEKPKTRKKPKNGAA